MTDPITSSEQQPWAPVSLHHVQLAMPRDGGLELHPGVEDPFAPARKAHP